jgi:hypothetical protein
MGLLIKPCKLNLANGTNLEVLMVTDSSQSSHPEICAGDIIGGINNNPIVAKEGTNWQQFYSGALKWVKSNQDVVKNLKLFRRTPGQPVQVTDGRCGPSLTPPPQFFFDLSVVSCVDSRQ